MARKKPDWRKEHRKLGAKIGKSITILLIVGGLLAFSPYEIKFTWTSLFIFLGIVVFLILYWHAWDVYDDIKKFFQTMKKDISYIKKRIPKEGDENE